MPKNDLFSEFPFISKADWLKKVSKDLKDKSLDDLEWHISDDLRLSPFVHAEDSTHPSPLWDNTKRWEIGEIIPVGDAATANVMALEALNGGVEGLQFECAQAPDWAVFEQILADIHLDFIRLHFSGHGVSQNPAGIFGHLLRLAKARNIDTRSLHGSVTYDPVQAGGAIADWRYLVDMVQLAQDLLPNVKILSIDFSRHENPVMALAETLKAGNEYLHKLSARGIPVEQVARFLQFSVPVGKSYFLEMAKLRALKLLWINILKGWDAPLSYPVIAATCQPEAYTDDLYTNMIRATSIAMSAVQGGADRLIVLPYDSGREGLASYPPSFGRRIARNVQHLMAMESSMGDMEDAVAGSYYVENLTGLLASKAWEVFVKPG